MTALGREIIRIGTMATRVTLGAVRIVYMFKDTDMENGMT